MNSCHSVYLWMRSVVASEVQMSLEIHSFAGVYALCTSRFCDHPDNPTAYTLRTTWHFQAPPRATLYQPGGLEPAEAVGKALTPAECSDGAKAARQTVAKTRALLVPATGYDFPKQYPPSGPSGLVPPKTSAASAAMSHCLMMMNIPPSTQPVATIS